MHRFFERTRFHYWTVRAFVEGWVLLLVHHGPLAVWRCLTHAPVSRPFHFVFSPVAQGYRPSTDVAVVVRPPGRLESDPLVVSPGRVRDFVRDVFPGAPPDPYLVARVALEQEHGTCFPAGLTGDPFTDHVWVSLGALHLHVSPDGQLAFLARSICRPPSEDAPLVEVVDVLLPLSLAAAAISSGALDRLLNVVGTQRRRFHWTMDVGERVAFPTPLAGPSPVGFPGHIPASVPFGGPRPEPSDAGCWGRDLSQRNCRAERCRRFRPGRSSRPLGLRERQGGRVRRGGRTPERAHRSAVVRITGFSPDSITESPQLLSGAAGLC